MFEYPEHPRAHDGDVQVVRASYKIVDALKGASVGKVPRGGGHHLEIADLEFHGIEHPFCHEDLEHRDDQKDDGQRDTVFQV